MYMYKYPLPISLNVCRYLPLVVTRVQGMLLQHLYHLYFNLFSVQQAILTFEDDQLDRALESLKRAQRVCCVENARKGAGLGMDEQLMRQILYADCELYMALLTFLKQGEFVPKFEFC